MECKKLSMNIRFVTGHKEREKTMEYFCRDCGQLRLSVEMNPTVCQNCKGAHLIIGEVGSLNKEALKAYAQETQ